MSPNPKRSLFWNSIDLESTEMYEHLAKISKLGTNLFRKMLTLEIDRLLADNIANNNMMKKWLRKYKHLLLEE